VGSRSNPYYGYPGYGYHHGNLSNFFMWYWLFHPHHRCDRNYQAQQEDTQTGSQSGGENAYERCDFDYQYAYGGEPNYGLGGWALLGAPLLGAGALLWVFRRRWSWRGGK
jgi:hypothetical protein